MKKLLFFLLFSAFAFGQNKFTATPTRIISDNNIVQLSGKSDADIYKALKTWIAKTYRNPEYVVKSDVSNEYVRLNGIWNVISRGPLGKSSLDVTYALTLDIKDNKLRYNLDEIGGINNFSYYNCFKSNGERRTTKEVTNYLNDIEMYAENFINDLIASINQKEDW